MSSYNANNRSIIKKERQIRVKKDRLLSSLKKNSIFSEFFIIEPRIDFSLGRPSPCLYDCEKIYYSGECGMWCQDCAIRI